MPDLPRDTDEEVGLRLAEVFDVQDRNLLGDEGTEVGAGRQGRYEWRMSVRGEGSQVPSSVQLLPLTRSLLIAKTV